MAIQRFYRTHNLDTQLYINGSRLYGLTTRFLTTGPARVKTSGHIGLKHRDIAKYEDGTSAPAGWSVQLAYKLAPTIAGLGPAPVSGDGGMCNSFGLTFPPNLVDQGNIRDVQQHYATSSLAAEITFSQPSAVQIEFWGFSHSDAYVGNGVDGLIQVLIEGGYCRGHLSVEVEC